MYMCLLRKDVMNMIQFLQYYLMMITKKEFLVTFVLDKQQQKEYSYTVHVIYCLSVLTEVGRIGRIML